MTPQIAHMWPVAVYVSLVFVAGLNPTVALRPLELAKVHFALRLSKLVMRISNIRRTGLGRHERSARPSAARARTSR